MTSPTDKSTNLTPITAGATTVTKETKTAASTQPKSGSVKEVSAPLQTTAADAWQKRLGAAHKVWSKLSESELKKSAGEPAKLAELVQLRYSISRPDADKQVKHFIDKSSN
jgi:hypothetical protein